MRGIRLWAIAIAVSVLPVAPGYASSSSNDAPAVDAKDKMICKRTQRTGTRFHSKICKTAAQWEALTEQHKRDMAETVNRPQVEIRRE